MAARECERDYGIRQLAEHIVRDVAAKDGVSELTAIENFLRARCRYTRDPRTVELVRSPKVILRELHAGRRPCIDCDDGTAFAIALGESIGYAMSAVTVAFRHIFHEGERQYTHVFSQALEPQTGTIIVVDFVPNNVAQMLRRVKAARIWPM